MGMYSSEIDEVMFLPNKKIITLYLYYCNKVTKWLPDKSGVLPLPTQNKQ